jgi:hypothetical protein
MLNKKVDDTDVTIAFYSKSPRKTDKEKEGQKETGKVQE